MSFTSFYTWGKSIDEASDDGTAGGVTYYNRRLEKARSNYDVAHRWVTYAIWDMPFGKGKRFLNSEQHRDEDPRQLAVGGDPKRRNRDPDRTSRITAGCPAP